MPQVCKWCRLLRNLHERQFGWSPACFAALRGDVQVLKEMLASRVNVNEQIKADEKRFHVERGMSLLHICAQFSSNVAMALLIEKGANLQLRDGIGASPLVRAGIGNNAEGVQMLIQAGLQNITSRQRSSCASQNARHFDVLSAIVGLDFCCARLCPSLSISVQWLWLLVVFKVQNKSRKMLRSPIINSLQEGLGNSHTKLTTFRILQSVASRAECVGNSYIKSTP